MDAYFYQCAHCGNSFPFIAALQQSIRLDISLRKPAPTALASGKGHPNSDHWTLAMRQFMYSTEKKPWVVIESPPKPAQLIDALLPFADHAITHSSLMKILAAQPSKRRSENGQKQTLVTDCLRLIIARQE